MNAIITHKESGNLWWSKTKKN